MDVFKTPRPNNAEMNRLTREHVDSPDHIYTAVKIIVDAKLHIPGVTYVPPQKNRPAQQMRLHITHRETDLRHAKSVGDYCYAEKKAWLLEYTKACKMKIQSRTIKNLDVHI